MQDSFARARTRPMLVCKIPLLARRTRPSARATIGYLVYKAYAAARPSARATIGYLVYKYDIIVFIYYIFIVCIRNYYRNFCLL